MDFQEHSMRIIFNNINMAIYNIVLEILQLKRHNPRINWKQKTVVIECGYITDSQPLHQLNAVKNKNYKDEKNPRPKYYAASSMTKQASRNGHQDYIIIDTGRRLSN